MYRLTKNCLDYFQIPSGSLGTASDESQGDAGFIRSDGAEPEMDLRELWKRMVFTMAISNTDDHLRNHGFLLTKKGWRLSPVFDINPVPYGDRLSLNVTQYDNTIDFSLALETAAYFGLAESDAEQTAAEICNNVKKNWRRLAEKNNLSRSSIEYMQPAFSAAENNI